MILPPARPLVIQTPWQSHYAMSHKLEQHSNIPNSPMQPSVHITPSLTNRTAFRQPPSVATVPEKLEEGIILGESIPCHTQLLPRACPVTVRPKKRMQQAQVGSKSEVMDVCK
jgi:hypothetical protein